MARLRAQQEKAQDKQAEVDELRAIRAQEAYERYPASPPSAVPARSPPSRPDCSALMLLWWRMEYVPGLVSRMPEATRIDAALVRDGVGSVSPVAFEIYAFVNVKARQRRTRARVCQLGFQKAGLAICLDSLYQRMHAQPLNSRSS